jgi:hypothetical protein
MSANVRPIGGIIPAPMPPRPRPKPRPRPPLDIFQYCFQTKEEQRSEVQIGAHGQIEFAQHVSSIKTPQFSSLLCSLPPPSPQTSKALLSPFPTLCRLTVPYCIIQSWISRSMRLAQIPCWRRQSSISQRVSTTDNILQA